MSAGVKWLFFTATCSEGRIKSLKSDQCDPGNALTVFLTLTKFGSHRAMMRADTLAARTWPLIVISGLKRGLSSELRHREAELDG
jgi:hypothetical protein